MLILLLHYGTEFLDYTYLRCTKNNEATNDMAQFSTFVFDIPTFGPAWSWNRPKLCSKFSFVNTPHYNDTPHDIIWWWIASSRNFFFFPSCQFSRSFVKRWTNAFSPKNNEKKPQTILIEVWSLINCKLLRQMPLRGTDPLLVYRIKFLFLVILFHQNSFWKIFRPQMC